MDGRHKTHKPYRVSNSMARRKTERRSGLHNSISSFWRKHKTWTVKTPYLARMPDPRKCISECPETPLFARSRSAAGKEGLLLSRRRQTAARFRASSSSTAQIHNCASRNYRNYHSRSLANQRTDRALSFGASVAHFNDLPMISHAIAIFLGLAHRSQWT